MTTNTTNYQIHTNMLQQIGARNFLAISGGRINRINETTIELPINQGYSVRIEYRFGTDTYTVQRIFRRGLKTWIKGEATEIYNDQLGEIAYMASCYTDPWTV